MKQSALRYLLALHRAHDALHHDDDLAPVVKATDRLRRIAPDQRMLPALDAKIARMKTIAGLLETSLNARESMPSPADDNDRRQ